MIKIENHSVSIENIGHPFQIIMETIEMLTGVEEALKQIDEDCGRNLTKVFYARLDDFNKLDDDELKAARKELELMHKLGIVGEFVACPKKDEKAFSDTSAESALDKLIKDIINGQQEL